MTVGIEKAIFPANKKKDRYYISNISGGGCNFSFNNFNRRGRRKIKIKEKRSVIEIKFH